MKECFLKAAAVQLAFIPVEEFYFALTLAVRTLEELEQPGLPEQVKMRLADLYGQPSTVAAASQNTYNYVFRVKDHDNSPSPQLIISISDWQEKLRLSSDYGWMLDAERKPIRTTRFDQRSAFCQQLRAQLQEQLQIPLLG